MSVDECREAGWHPTSLLLSLAIANRDVVVGDVNVISLYRQFTRGRRKRFYSPPPPPHSTLTVVSGRRRNLNLTAERIVAAYIPAHNSSFRYGFSVATL